jgi:GcrA cell cycle regulator
MNEEIKSAESPVIFDEGDMASDANELATTTDLISPLLGRETIIETPGRKRPKMVTTLTLTSDNCRWPFGDPTKSGFHYCGRLPQLGRPYCDTHDRMSYQASTRKKPS